MVVGSEVTSSEHHAAVVWFASDSRNFLDAVEPRIPVVFWVKRCGRRKPAVIIC